MANRLGMIVKPSTSNDWYASYLEILKMAALQGGADDCYFVSPGYADGDLGADIASAVDRRFFPTIQAAIDAISETGHAGFATIYVSPGLYQENLTITKSVAIIGITPPFYRGLAGASGAVICGTASGQSPTITITPPNGDYICVHFGNLSLFNQYNATAGQINNAYLIKVNAQSTYGAMQNYLTLQRCDIRGQTWGLNNDWQSGIKAAGWNSVSLRDCDYTAYKYAGGGNNGGICRLFDMVGDNANAKATSLRVVGRALSNAYGGGYANPCLIYINNNANVTVAKSAIYRESGAYAVNGGTASNTTAGIGSDLVNGTPAVAAAYGNLLGIDLAGM